MAGVGFGLPITSLLGVDALRAATSTQAENYLTGDNGQLSILPGQQKNTYIRAIDYEIDGTTKTILAPGDTDSNLSSGSNNIGFRFGRDRTVRDIETSRQTVQVDGVSGTVFTTIRDVLIDGTPSTVTTELLLRENTPVIQVYLSVTNEGSERGEFALPEEFVERGTRLAIARLSSPTGPYRFYIDGDQPRRFDEVDYWSPYNPGDGENSFVTVYDDQKALTLGWTSGQILPQQVMTGNDRGDGHGDCLSFTGGPLEIDPGETRRTYLAVVPHAGGSDAPTRARNLMPDQPVFRADYISQGENTPTAAFSFEPADPTQTAGYTQSKPVVGEQIVFDAVDSEATDGSLQSYEWDFDDDGTFSMSGQRVERGFSTVGDQEVTLRVTDDQRNTATTTQTVTVGLGGRPEKLRTASLIDERSTLEFHRSTTSTDVPGDLEMARTTIESIETAVANGDIDQATAEAAMTRIRTMETASLQVIDRLGPTGDDGINVTLYIGRTIVQTIVDLIFAGISLAIGAAAGAASGGTLTAVAAFAAETLLEVPQQILGDMIASQSEDSRPGREFARTAREQTQSLIEQIVDGVLNAADEISDAIDDLVDRLVLEFAKRYQRDFEFQQNLVGGFPPVYETLQSVTEAFEAAELDGGLDGTTGTAEESVETGLAEIDRAIGRADEYARENSRLLDDISWIEELMDILGGNEIPANRIYGFVLDVVDSASGGLLASLLTAENLLIGYDLSRYTLTLHQRMAQSTIQGASIETGDFLYE